LQQLIDVYEKKHSTIIGTQEVPFEDVLKYRIINPIPLPIEDKMEDTLAVKKLVEKLSLKQAPSQLAVIGRYILTPEIFPILEKLSLGAGGEYQLTDAINIYNQS
jgi:UTP--glucose-1-phosphate uridylyltransferase